MFGPELIRAFQEFKLTWDPTNKLNPHKIVDPYLPTENLRLGLTTNRLSQKLTSNFSRRGFLRESRFAMYRTRSMPEASRWLDVPELHGHA